MTAITKYIVSQLELIDFLFLVSEKSRIFDLGATAYSIRKLLFVTTNTKRFTATTKYCGPIINLSPRQLKKNLHGKCKKIYSVIQKALRQVPFFLNLFIYSFIYLFIYLFIHLFTYLFVYLFIKYYTG